MHSHPSRSATLRFTWWNHAVQVCSRDHEHLHERHHPQQNIWNRPGQALDHCSIPLPPHSVYWLPVGCPLVRRMYAGRLLATSIILFGALILLVPIIEGATGGFLPKVTTGGSKISSTWGNWSPYLVMALYPIASIFWGMVELMRRVIPAEIVGDNSVKLRRMDGIVHVCYEVTGTIGALFAPYWISYFGWGFALTIMPIAYILAACVWVMIVPSQAKVAALARQAEERKKNPAASLARSSTSSTPSSTRSSQRALIWLMPAYALALVHHRYLESTLFPFFAKSTLGNSDYQSILTGGSNFGELVGALLVVVFARQVKTPIPFLRMDAILILVVWVLPFITVDKNNVIATVWKLAPMMSIISLGWAAGDVSLAAYVQSRLARLEFSDEYTSPSLPSCPSSTSPTSSPTLSSPTTKELYIWIGGVFMTICGAIVFAATFIPRGSFKFNPDPDVVDFDSTIRYNDEVLQETKGEEGEAEKDMKDSNLVAMAV
ncbi:hypothetical protein BC829DRAFT_430446 [Chytridium lagenaria]|nr:hypothetical protein BC829DRAFT_430446 [Chytridium lagenaria]